MMSLRGRVSDFLRIKKRQAPKVFCICCREHIYYLRYEGRGPGLENLAPLAGMQRPKTETCPRCGMSIYARMNNKNVLKTDKGYVQ